MNEEIIEDIENSDEEFNVKDKRRFNEDGERMDMEIESEPQAKSFVVLQLEKELVNERTRREAAENKLVGVQVKFDEMKSQMERETSDMRRRLQKTNDEKLNREKGEFVSALLPVLDNINLAIDHAEKDSSLEHLLAGVKGTARLFEQNLISIGVEPLVSIGEVFNPELHEAIDIVETDAENDGKIVGEFGRGYKFGERLLRPARVQVGKAMAQKAAE